MNLEPTSKIYLASPYTHEDPDIVAARFNAACMTTVHLTTMGLKVFSPIVYGHSLVLHGLPGDWDYWKEYDEAFLLVCHSMIVLQLEGWKESVGVQAEIDHMESQGKLIQYLDPQNGFDGIQQVKDFYDN